MLTKILLVGGLVIALYGLIGLIAVWLAPSLRGLGQNPPFSGGPA